MRFLVLASLMWLFQMGCAHAGDQPVLPPGLASPPESPPPEIRDLGKGKYQIGHILLDKGNKTFSVPGKILRLEPPIEFLAISKGGSRGYEGFLELEANPIEFNLACILIGLEEKKGAPPKFHFDPAPIEGSTVKLLISWQADGKRKEMPVTDLLEAGKKKKSANEWVYTGSRFAPDGRYMAEAAGGTLVGLIHDPDSIIEHRTGYSQDSFSNLKAEPELVPPLETPIELVVKRAN